jgi:GH25 family lysozyme M1 (1,4-beta-N-acetylmuramidase)
MKGIDVSYCQRCFNWARYDGFFAMVKASQGRSDYGSYMDDFVVDSEFRRNAEGCRLHGIPFGAYHYLTAQDTAEARREADKFCDTLAPYRADMRLWAAVDVESQRWLPRDHAMLTQVVRAFTDEVAARGYKPMAYTNPSFLAYRFTKPAGVPLWLAYWGATERKAKQYEPTIWQYGIDPDYGVDGNIGYFILSGPTSTDASRPVYAVGDDFTIPEDAKYSNGLRVPARLIGKTYEIGKVKDGAVYLPKLWSWVKA